MDKPRDIQDRLMKLMLGCPRMVRDLLALLPAEWTAALDATVLRELPPSSSARTATSASRTCAGSPGVAGEWRVPAADGKAPVPTR